MPPVTDALHQLESGAGPRRLRTVAGLMLAGLLALLYNWRGFHNLSNPEAMDAAQLGRNLAEGRGYTTSCIRPLSMHLLKERDQDLHGLPAPGATTNPDPYRIKGPHPDISNPPVYPLVLAGLMKVLPFKYEISDAPSTFWAPGGRFKRYQPDFLIALFNQALLVAVAVSLFFFARRYFDPSVAWLSMFLLLGTDLLWRFSMSGLPTLLLMLIFMGLVWALALFEEETRQPRFGPGGLYLLAAATGLLVGLGALTLYSFAWLALPAVAFVAAFASRRRWLLGGITLATFALVLGAWVARNLALCGAPFGTCSSALAANPMVPEFRLERSLDPAQIPVSWLTLAWVKLATLGHRMLQEDLPRLGGTWLTAFFLVGLLVRFQNSTLRRLRLFLLASLGLLFVAQALGRTRLSEDSPEVTSENLLVLLTPLVILYGVSLVCTLLDTVQPRQDRNETPELLPSLLKELRLSWARLRISLLALFAIVMSLPFLLSCVTLRVSPVAWPPYNPPTIQRAAGWLKPTELMMSDIPWAIAWYGQRQCLWLTLNIRDGFIPINDYQRAINAVFLSPVTLDKKFGSEMLGVYVDKETKTVRVGGAELFGWTDLLCQFYTFNLQVPRWFPLRYVAPLGGPTQQLLLTDWERWPKPEK